MQRMGARPILCVNYWHNDKLDVDADANVAARATCKQAFKRHKSNILN